MRPTAAPGTGTGAGAEEEGVLHAVGGWMATAIGLIAVVAVVEAGYNLGVAVLDILHLPLPLAVAFPVLAETTAGTFAVQDLRDRRQGQGSRALRASTHVTLVASAAVNGAVGVWAHGVAGGLEVMPPMVLAAIIHIHGDRATRAHRSRAVLRPEWRAEQLRAAQVASVVEVLPILAGTDPDGRATVELLRWRLEARTLSPGEALIAAGWHDRSGRAMPVPRLRRLETVAATVWGDDGPPPAPVQDEPVVVPAQEPHPEAVVSPDVSPDPALVRAAAKPAAQTRPALAAVPRPASPQERQQWARQEATKSGSWDLMARKIVKEFDVDMSTAKRDVARVKRPRTA